MFAEVRDLLRYDPRLHRAVRPPDIPPFNCPRRPAREGTQTAARLGRAWSVGISATASEARIWTSHAARSAATSVRQRDRAQSSIRPSRKLPQRSARNSASAGRPMPGCRNMSSNAAATVAKGQPPLRRSPCSIHDVSYRSSSRACKGAEMQDRPPHMAANSSAIPGGGNTASLPRASPRPLRSAPTEVQLTSISGAIGSPCAESEYSQIRSGERSRTGRCNDQQPGCRVMQAGPWQTTSVGGT